MGNGGVEPLAAAVHIMALVLQTNVRIISRFFAKPNCQRRPSQTVGCVEFESTSLGFQASAKPSQLTSHIKQEAPGVTFVSPGAS